MKRCSLNRLINVAVASALLGFAGCAPRSQADAQAEVFRADAEWLKAVQARDAERALSYWADDAIVFSPGSPAVSGKAAIREFVAKSLSTPGFSITWNTAAVVVSGSGDLAYTTGTNRVTVDAPDGKQVVIDGKAVSIWRRQKDGAWKCVVDIWNDAAPPQ